jgi:RimJ/RimL family protein N-acetyltransferase
MENSIIEKHATELTTERLILRPLQHDDAEFILDLLNQPTWLHYIGDRNVHSIEDAIAYIENGPMAMYCKHGFGLLLVMLKNEKTPLGLCGLLQRDNLPFPDIGFAFHPQAWGNGYAVEAAAACVNFASDQLGLAQLLAITMSGNASSIRLLTAIGMQYERDVVFAPSDEVLQLFSRTFS